MNWNHMDVQNQVAVEIERNIPDHHLQVQVIIKSDRGNRVKISYRFNTLLLVYIKKIA